MRSKPLDCPLPSPFVSIEADVAFAETHLSDDLNLAAVAEVVTLPVAAERLLAGDESSGAVAQVLLVFAAIPRENAGRSHGPDRSDATLHYVRSTASHFQETAHARLRRCNVPGDRMVAHRLAGIHETLDAHVAVEPQLSDAEYPTASVAILVNDLAGNVPDLTTRDVRIVAPGDRAVHRKAVYLACILVALLVSG